MAMGYIDSTPPQVARVVGGWFLGGGIILFILTFKQLGSVHPPSGAITAIILIACGVVLLFVGGRRLAQANRANLRFFAENAGTKILAQRRRLQSRLIRLLVGFLLAFLVSAAFWVVVVATRSCVDEVCSGIVPNQASWVSALRLLCVVLGAVTLILATLSRVHGSETDRWEELASDYLRRRDDGPVTGLKRSRWE